MSSSSSISLRHSSRHPLQELPLDHFLLAPPMSTKLGSSTKRPVSPGTSMLYSPAKRRILNEEGLFTAKSPLSASAVASSSKKSQHPQRIARFADALMGPDSPVRKLDFGAPKNATGSRTPTRESVVGKLVPSPEIKAGSRSRSRSHEMDEDHFSISSRSQTQPPQSQSHPQSQTFLSSSSSVSSSQSQRRLDFLSVPRELPPPIDPQSDHYPGFVVYQDSYLLIPTLRLSSPMPLSTPNFVLAAVDENVDNDSDAESVDVREFVKENLAPRRKACKAAMAPTPGKAQLFSPPSAKSSSLPTTPPRDLIPRQLSIFGGGNGSGPGEVQDTSSKQNRHTMRRVLEEEVDGEQGDD